MIALHPGLDARTSPSSLRAALVASPWPQRGSTREWLVASGLEKPIYATPAPGEPTRLFVIEKPGRIRVLVVGELRSEPLLDISECVAMSVDEMGLLGWPSFALRTQRPVLRHVLQRSRRRQ